jgi:nucleoside-diphosphate-sugar epimerase
MVQGERPVALHVIVGAGIIGSATALRLAQCGHHVRLVSRSGRGPAAPGIELFVADATDPDRLVEAATGAEAVYNCANPPYNRWVTDWPPLAASVLDAAERTGAVLVTMSNLYGYGPVAHPMTEHDPQNAHGRKGRVRARMWADVLAANTAGRVRATEARASDYFGPGVRSEGHIGERTIVPVLNGRSVQIIGNPDVPHSWTYVPDIAAALVTLGTDPRAWGRAWHVPTDAALSQRALLQCVAKLAAVREPKLQTLPGWAFKTLGIFVPVLRELDEVRYQFEAPFVMDSSDYQTTFGVGPTPMAEALGATVEWWLHQASRT